MTRTRLVWTLIGLFLLGSALAIWAAVEARYQRHQVEGSLRAQASLLARTLAPSLAAAAAAARELDELVGLKLLDNARLLARLDASGRLTRTDLDEVLETNDLEAILILDARGNERLRGGADHPPELRVPEALDVAAGAASEAVISWSPEEAHGHVAAVAARPGGGAVVVRAHETGIYARANRLGVSRLLQSTVGTGGVLYLAFREEPGGESTESSWDDRPVPPAPAEPGRIRDVRGRASFEVEVPVDSPAGRSGLLRIGLDGDPLLRATVSATRRTTLIGFVLVAFGLAGAALAVVSRARERERAEAAKRLLTLDMKRRRSERLAAAGSLAAGVAHEIRNPLNAISLAAQRIERKKIEDPDCREFALRIRSEVERLEEILKGFLDLARPASGPQLATDLRDLAREVAGLLEVEARACGVVLEVEGGGDAVLSEVDREAVRRALLNLVRNAVEASPESASVTVAVEAAGSGARIRVSDRGAGVSPELAGHAFDPFVTTRAEGVGLGLALVRRVAEEHGGWARLESRPGGGTDAIFEVHVEDEGQEEPS